MPLILDDPASFVAAAPATAGPRFFSSKLTGDGRTHRGLLSADLGVDGIVSTQAYADDVAHSLLETRSSVTQSSITTTTMPFAPLASRWLSVTGASLAMPDSGHRFEVNAADPDWRVFLALTPQGARMFEDTTRGPRKRPRQFVIGWRMELFFVRRGIPEPDRVRIGAGRDAWAEVLMSVDPLTDAADFIRSTGKVPGAAQRRITAGWTDETALGDWLDDVNVHDAIAACARIWDSTDIADETIALIDHLVSGHGTAGFLGSTAMTALEDQLHYLENYNIPLEAYRTINAHLEQTFSDDVTAVLARQNLNLLMSHALSNLDRRRAGLATIPAPGPNVTVPSRLSAQQRAAVTTREPLALAQAGAGTGKAQPLDEPVLTPDGWVAMGDLKVGDLVIGSDGRPTRVQNIFDRGPLDGYRLTFRDGSSTRVAADHLWTLLNQSRTGEQSRVMTTQEWIDSPSQDKRYLPVVEPVQFSEKELPLDPYLLGALIADGNLHNSAGYTKSEQSVSDAVGEAAAHDGFTMYETTCRTATARHWGFRHSNDIGGHHSEFRNRLRALGLDVLSAEKFIPTVYLTASVDQRRRLVAGLFDGDGRIRTGRAYAQYSTTSDRLADDVLQLLWSLGLSATKHLNRHKRGDYWIISLLSDYDPFWAARYRGLVSGSVRPMRRALKSAEKIDSLPMRCIVVEAEDSLYVTKDFLVTHNSSVILARIDHMAACGVDPSDITVLSFTNAAADHICEKNPGVGSMTIAAMINDIYRLNHPTHEISSIPTIRNSLDIYFPGSDLAARLKRHLLDLENKEVGATTELNNFVETHFDDVMALLDGIGQTSLELEIIICYQRIDSMAEPPRAACHHLIVDEVQDTSIFEFVYLLKFAAKHSTSLFMVGDASQTLYEFRAANPRALNTLEASGVFATYRLTTNYRSNQEILDFANVALGGLETNRFAGIQLRANSLAVPTAASFTQKVTLDHRFTPQVYKFVGEELAGIIASTVARDYIDPALDRGEKVAFLAYSRREVDAVEAALEQRYPGRTIANLVSERPFDTTIFSNYVKLLWNDVLMVQPADAAFTMTQDIMSNLGRLSRGRMSPAAEKAMRALVSQWWIQNAAAVNGWVKLVAAGRITAREFFARLRSNVLDFEIRHNSVHQNMVNQRNRERKERNQNADAQLIVSTIHGVKGLEFDNVVVIHRDSPDMSQEMRRLFYVAFTRAAGTEYVLSYGSQKDSPIVSDYELVVDALEKAEARAAIIAAGGDPDAPDPDDAPVGAPAA